MQAAVSQIELTGEIALAQTVTEEP